MKLKVDLHVHTIYSGDSTITPREAVERAVKLRLDALAITDHDSFEGYEKIEKDSNPLIVPGIEISSKDGHILGLGLLEPIELGLTAFETIEQIHRLGGLAIIPHPMNPLKHSLKKNVLNSIEPDALESLNASTLPPFTFQHRKIEDLAKRRGIPKTGGSDAHIPSNIGKAYTIVEAKKPSVEDIITAIKTGRITPAGNFLSVADFIPRVWIKIGNKIKNKCT